MKRKALSIAVIILMTCVNIFGQKEKMQSAYIYTFITKYFEWPDSYKSGDFCIGVLGDSPIIQELNTMTASRKVGNQKIVVKKFNSADEITRCHVLYISDSKMAESESALGKIGSTLVITDSESASTKGIAIIFKMIGNKQKFELKAYNATTRGLIVSPELGQMLVSEK